MIKNKKLLIIMSLVIFILFFSFTSCFAYTIDENNATTCLNLVNEYCKNKNMTVKNYVITGKSTDCRIFVASQDDSKIFVQHGEAGGLVQDWLYISKVHIFKFNDTGNISDVLFESGSAAWASANDLIYSSFDVMKGDTIFFQKAPVGQGIVAQKMKGTKPEKVMEEIIQILPMILVLMVSLIGLRKALKMLLSLLHRA